MKRTIGLALALMLGAGAAQAQMSVQLQGAWNGKAVPKGQQCPFYGGHGATPPMRVTGIPRGAAWLYVAFNDRDYPPLSRDGGHGVIGFPVHGHRATLPPVPGMRPRRLPGGARVISAARATGKLASPGFLPPCSGGKGHRYMADVKAVSARGRVLAEVRVPIGRY